MVRLVGDDILRRVAVTDHQCRDERDMVHVGETSRGTPVKFNRRGGSGQDSLLLAA